VVKGRYRVWQRRFLFASVAAVCTFLIHLLLAIATPAQSIILPLATKPIQHSIAFLAPPRYLGTIVRQVNLGNAHKAIALTFDDGPWFGTTAQVLDILKEKNIKATFFLIGQNLKKFPQVGQRIVAEGHAIGNHTWHHWHRPMSEFTATREIEDTAMLLQEVTGVKTYLFRPPHGFLYNGLADYALNHKQVVVTWSIDSGDWHKHGISVEGLVNRVVENAKPGAIVLLHDGGGDRSKTVQALPQMIDQLRKRGYDFVTVPELLQMKDREFAQKPNS
jgi:peptidoglycan/xylan/chitin deacetylase (PgdA/CDA1 family)